MKKGYRKFFDSIFILSIKRGLMLAIPFLILGSFALLLSSFPLDAYQSFLTSFHHGALLTVFNSLYEITLNSLALILIITIALSYGQLHALDDVFFYPVVAMISYLAFCGGMEYANEIFHPEWVFTAMCITILSCWLFHKGMHVGQLRLGEQAVQLPELGGGQRIGGWIFHRYARGCGKLLRLFAASQEKQGEQRQEGAALDHGITSVLDYFRHCTTGR